MSFGIIYHIHFLEIMALLTLREGFLRGWGRPQKAEGVIFLLNQSFKNDTKMPGTDKSLFSPREYSCRLMEFVEEWERVREKLNIYLSDKKIVCTKIKPAMDQSKCQIII